MKTTILIIHGAGVRSYKVLSEKWVPFIDKALDHRYEIIAPEMPNPQYPQYKSWSNLIKETIAQINGPLLLIGHSLGGTILLKYLSEESVPNHILGLYLIASPYFSTTHGWNYQDFFIHKDPTELLAQFPVYSYHSTDDEIVPVSHQGYIASKLPNAVVRTLSGHGHEYNRKEFKEIIDDIRQHERTGYLSKVNGLHP